MANNHFLASIYRIGNNDLNTLFSTATSKTPATEGIQYSFPSGLCQFSPTPNGFTANGVTMASIITVLPTGLQVKPTQYYTDSTVSTLNTAAT